MKPLIQAAIANARSALVLVIAGTLVGGSLTSAVAQQPSTHLKEVTLNGRTIDPDLFSGWALGRLSPVRTCPPYTDPYIRDSVLMRLLVINEAIRKEKQPSKYSAEKIRQVENELDELVQQSAQAHQIQRKKATRLRTRYNAFQEAVFLTPDESAVHQEHRRAILARDPKFVDVIALQVRRLQLINGYPRTDAVIKQLRNGATLNDIIKDHRITKKSKGMRFDRKVEKNWVQVKKLLYYKGDGRDLSVGDVIGPRSFGATTGFEFIVGKHVIPLLLLDQQYFGYNNFANQRLRLRLSQRRKFEIITQLYEGADIRVNGAQIKTHVLTRGPNGFISGPPRCPR